MQSLQRFDLNYYEVQDELVSTAENGELYAVDYGKAKTLPYLKGLLNQLSFEEMQGDSWVMRVNSKCSLYLYFSRCLTSNDSEFSVSSFFWRGEYTRMSGKVDLITGGFSIEEIGGEVMDSELLGEEILDKVRDFLEQVDTLIEIDNLKIRSVTI